MDGIVAPKASGEDAYGPAAEGVTAEGPVRGERIPARGLILWTLDAERKMKLRTGHRSCSSESENW